MKLLGLDPISVIDSNVIVAFIAAVATVMTAIIALRKDRQASPTTTLPPQHGASDSGIVTVLVSRISELEDRDNEHDKIEAALWEYIRRLQSWRGAGPMPLPPVFLVQRQEEESER